jgi:hypothetical protein
MLTKIYLTKGGGWFLNYLGAPMIIWCKKFIYSGLCQFALALQWLAAYFCQSPQSQVEYNRTRLNVKLLAGCIVLFRIVAILVSCKESRHSFCTLHESLYWASGAPSGITDVQIKIQQRAAVLQMLIALLLLAYTKQIRLLLALPGAQIQN